MPPIVLSPLEGCFSFNVRKRGQEYARSGFVTLQKCPSPAKLVDALVHGSGLYQVTLRYEDNVLLGACTCPYFIENLELCKHIWATLIECETKKIEFPGRVEDVLADEEAGFGDDDDDDDNDDYDDDDDLIEHRNVVPLRRSPQPMRREWVPPSRWRTQVGSATAGAQPVSVTPPPPEITWVIDPATSGANLYLEVTTRSRKKNGELGKPQVLRIDHSAVSRIESPIDREIISILASAHYTYYTYGSVDARLAIGWPLAEYVVPKIAETGRLWIRVGKGEYETSVTFDGGDPWHLAVRAEEQEGKYVLVSSLQRGEVSRPVADALAITRGGLVVFRNSIARFADDGSQAWTSLLRQEKVEIPAAEIDDFVKAVASSQAPLRIDFPSTLGWKERRVSPRPAIELRDRGYGYLEGVPTFEYDGQAENAFAQSRTLFDEKTRTIFVRDTAEESRMLGALGGQGFHRQGNSVVISGPRLHEVIAKLMDAGWEVRNDGGVYAGSGELELAISSGIDWFDVGGSVSFGKESVRLPRLLAALRKGETVVRLADGRLGMVRPEWREQLEPFLAAAMDENEGGLRFRRNQVLLLDALLATRPKVSFDEVFEQARRRILDVKIEPEQPQDSFSGTLRPYQSEGLGWFSFLRDLGFGGCLADDMGLGKTIQVLALLDQRRAGNDEHRPSLVVVPRSVVFNWKTEAARFTPKLRVLDHSTPDRVRAADHFAQYDIVLTTYALLRREAELFADVEFDYVILDEAQAIKNASSQAAKAASLLRARHRLALSGTPVENHLGELASLFEFLNPGMLRAKSSRVVALLRHAGSKAPEAANARTMLARAVRPFILRRTKAQVAPELPDRVEQTIWCELEPKQRKLYDELREYYRASLLGRVATKGMNRSKIHILEALLRMRQAACHPGLVDKKRIGETSAKLDALFEELPALIEGGHKVLVFSQFTSLLAIVRSEARQRGLTHAYIDGASRDREAQVKRFQEDPSVPLFLISLKAGGLGLNLTAAEYVFLLDPWWNPAVEAQAIDRAHRIGQSRNVFAYRLVARDTIEEKILQLQQTKRDLADAIIGAENSILRQLTPEDLDLLLS
ncbi:MAG: DEAD/DEAH box helicase [Acidobacteriota bacterium]|nr:DEAD/DEAH box helicase [Acidobacteriota bacterium]